LTREKIRWTLNSKQEINSGSRVLIRLDKVASSSDFTITNVCHISPQICDDDDDDDDDMVESVICRISVSFCYMTLRIWFFVIQRTVLKDSKLHVLSRVNLSKMNIL